MLVLGLVLGLGLGLFLGGFLLVGFLLYLLFSSLVLLSSC